MSCLPYCCQARFLLENNLEVQKSKKKKKPNKPQNKNKNRKENPQQLGSFAITKKDVFALNYTKIKSADSGKKSYLWHFQLTEKVQPAIKLLRGGRAQIAFQRKFKQCINDY